MTDTPFASGSAPLAAPEASPSAPPRPSGFKLFHRTDPWEESGGPVLYVANLADVPPERIEWLWPGRIAIGKMTMLAGDPGLGKSLAAMFVAAAVTTGGAWPCGEGTAETGNVIILSAEDGLSDTLRPRIDAAGGNPERVDVVRSLAVNDHTGRRAFDLGQDLAALEGLIEARGDVRLVIIDPVSSYMRGDSHKNTEVRAVLEPIAEMAERRRVAVLLITHLSKGSGRAMHRFIGSIAFVAAARAAFAVVADPEDAARRLLLQVKNNISAGAPGLSFHLEERPVAEGIAASVVVWGAAPVTATVDEAMSTAAGGAGRMAKDEAAAFLKALLADGPKPVREIEAEAVAAGLLRSGTPVSQSRLLRGTRESLGVVACRRGGLGGKGEWVWSLPDPC